MITTLFHHCIFSEAVLNVLALIINCKSKTEILECFVRENSRAVSHHKELFYHFLQGNSFARVREKQRRDNEFSKAVDYEPFLIHRLLPALALITDPQIKKE